MIYENDSNYFTDKNIIDNYEQVLSSINENQIYDIINLIIDTIKNMKYDNNKLLATELCFIKINSMLMNKKDESVEKQDKIVLDSKVNVKESKQVKSEQIVAKQTNNNYDSKLKKIRINNTLCMFNKKDMMSFKNNTNILNDYIAEPKYSSLISLIFDGELKAKGKNYLLYVYKNNSLVDMFNQNIEQIEKMLKDIYKEDYRVIAESIDNWDVIKKEFNKALREKRKIYKYIDEKKILNKKEEKTEKKIDKITKTPIDNMFEEIVQYN